MPTKWIAKREAVAARTDEDAAMAYQMLGRRETREEAREALLYGLAYEVEAFDGWGARESAGRAAQALAHLILNPTHNQAEFDGVRWSLVEMR